MHLPAHAKLIETNKAVDKQLVVLEAIRQLNDKFFKRLHAGEVSTAERIEHLCKIQTLKDKFATL